MTAALLSMVGTPAGHRLAIGLALLAAVLHALFGALQKGRDDPWITRAAIDASYGLIAAPFALFVVPWPEPHMWPIFAGAFTLHAFYKIVQAMTYDRAPYTVVYPVVRGMGPFVTVLFAALFLASISWPANGWGWRCWWQAFWALEATHCGNWARRRQACCPRWAWPW
jgi:drug/metabolite transporter (DMT)-like permease